MSKAPRGYYGRLLKTILMLSLPTIAEQILSTLMQYVDTAMVGRLGDNATAAVNVTTTVTWLTNSVPSAIGVGVLALISRYFGAHDDEKIRSVSKISLLLTVIFGAASGALSMALSPFIPVWMGAQPDVRADASMYFFIISIPMVFRAATTIFGAAIRAVQNTRTPMIISLASNLLNVGLNYLLIYTAGLGVVGAAIATAACSTLSGLLMFLAWRKNVHLRWGWCTFRIEKPILTQCLKTSVPVLGTNVVSCMGYVVFAGLVSGSMGTAVFAAHSIAVTAETIFYIPGYGLRTATSALVGAALGERDKRKFDAVCGLSVIITLVMMMINGVLLYYVSYPLMSLFTSSAETARLGAEMLKLVAFSEPFFGLMVVMEGVFYGLGRTRYAFIAESASMWGVRILFTFFCVKLWGLDLYAVWLCMIADNVCKALLFTIPVLSKKRRSRLFVPIESVETPEIEA